jgi:hypothetical protein
VTEGVARTRMMLFALVPFSSTELLVESLPNSLDVASLAWERQQAASGISPLRKLQPCDASIHSVRPSLMKQQSTPSLEA